MSRCFLILLSAALVSVAPAQKPATYDEAANAHELIDTALTKARRDDKRVMVVFGANWCGWCHKLADAFKRRELRRPLRDDYEVVKVDIGKWDKNLDLVKKYEADIKQHGVPFITVLDSKGEVVKNQPTTPLEEGKEHSTEKLLAFLKANKPTPLDATAVLASAISAAKKSDRKVLVHLGAPW